MLQLSSSSGSAFELHSNLVSSFSHGSASNPRSRSSPNMLESESRHTSANARSLSESSEEPQRPRRRNPKVKSGCVTCKIRRVKCDERKPGCLRCEKFGYPCDGYGTSDSSSPEPQKPVRIPIHTTHKIKGRPILPKNEQRTSAPSVVIRAVQPRQAMFNNEQEHLYFQWFNERTAESLSGYFSGTLWNKLVLQACHQQPSIRHAIIAVGALDKTIDTTPGISDLHGRPPSHGLEPEVHHQFALQQYGKAMKYVREALMANHPDMRTTLITCLLAFCFETFHGNRKSALTHARSGIMLLNEWLPKVRKGGAYQAGSPAPNMLEDELVHAYTSLDASTHSLDAGPLVQTDLILEQDAIHSLLNMPSSFSSLVVARAYLDLLRRSVTHFIVGCYRNDWTAAAMASGAVVIPWTQRAEPLAQFNMFKDAFLRWSEAFQPMLHKARISADRKDLLVAIGIRLRYEGSYTAFVGCLNDEPDLDLTYEDCDRVLCLAEEWAALSKIQENGIRPNYTFDGSLLPALHVFTLKCRDPVLRRRGIALLDAVPRREGLWDSRVSASICRTAMNLEECFDGCQIVCPKELRLHYIQTSYDLQERSGTLSFRRLQDVEQKTFTEGAVTFTW